MKHLFLFTLALASAIGLKAQAIPTNPTVRVSYDVEETNFKQLPANANLSLLTDLEKVEFKKRTVTKHVDVYLDRNNDVTTVITYLSRQGFDGVTHGPTTKLVMDKNGTFDYDASGRLVSSSALDQKEVNDLASLKATINPQKFLEIPEYTQPTSEDIRNAAANGNTITATENRLTAKMGNIEYVYDKQQQFILFRELGQDGKETSSVQKFYIVNGAGQKVPSLTIDRVLQPSLNGLPVENILLSKYSNYTRTTAGI